jgi:hypothetical protein
MKKLLLALMVMASLVSCGKKNQVSTDGSSSSAITLNDNTAVQLGSLIDNSETQFGYQQVTAYETWNQAALNHPNYYYKYTASAGSSSNCVQKTGWLGIKYWVCSSSSSSSATVSRSVVVGTVDLAAKRNELKGYINSGYAGSIIASGPVFYVRTNAGVVYTIDTRLPIQANPTGIQQANGQIEYFLRMDL